MTRLRHEVTVYSVYEPAREEDDIATRAEAIAFVKEGFSWLALFFPLLWLLYYRMWIEFAAFLAITIGLEWAFGGSAEGAEILGWIGLAITVLFAFEANDLRTAMLERRGYRFAGIATGRDRIEAEHSFFTAWLRQEARPSRPVPPAAKITPGAARPASRGGAGDVIGLFPQG